MKRTALIVSGLILAFLSAGAQEFEKAADAVRNMKVGWNLGNTLDCHSASTTNMWIEKWTECKPSDYETAWGQPAVTPELIKMFKDAGFNSIRVPVTWYPHMGLVTDGLNWDKENNPIADTADTVWLKRVHEVVDYVVSQGMYCILNVHHDTGESDVAWVVADRNVYDANKDKFMSLWTQIANEFKDYDEHLLFEGYNEMLDRLGSWVYASSKATSGYNSSIASSAYAAVNGFAQSFVDAVRSTGGNNISRNLIVSDYCASNCMGTGHAKDPFKKMKMPTDTLDGHLILEVHSYILEMSNLANSKNDADGLFNDLYSYFISKGVPVIVGEWGTLNTSGNDFTDSGRYADFKSFCRYFVEQAKKKDIATLYWMGLSEGADRSVPKWTLEDLKDMIIKGYYGDGGYDKVAPVTREPIQYHSDYWLNNRIYIRNGRKFYSK